MPALSEAERESLQDSSTTSHNVWHGGPEATPVKNLNEKRMNVAEMKMLRWMSGVTRRDRIPN